MNKLFAATISLWPVMVSAQPAPSAGPLLMQNNLGEIAAHGAQSAARANLGIGTASTLPIGAVAVQNGNSTGEIGGMTAGGTALSTVATQAAGAVQAAGGNASATNVTAVRAPSARTLAARAADVVNVKDFGAKCDGVTDDAAAINAAIAYANTLTFSGKVAARVVFPGGACVVQSAPINLTMIRSHSVTIDGGGTSILGKTAGMAVVDALGSQNLTVRDFRIYGDPTLTPRIGFQFGRNGNAITCGDHNFDNLRIEGYFTLAGAYNFASEGSVYNKLYIQNLYNSALSYDLVLDAFNHFGVTSQFLTQSAPADTRQSFNQNTFTSASFFKQGAGSAIWMGGTRRAAFINSYAAQQVPGPTVVLYSASSADANTQATFDLHVETPSAGPTSIFQFSGPNPNPVAASMYVMDYGMGNQTTTSIFAADTGVTAVSLPDLSLHINSLLSTEPLFDQPTIYTVSGDVFLGNYPTNWNLPAANFKGRVNLAGAITLSGSGTFSALGSGLAQSSSGVLSVSIPSPLAVSSIATGGSVATMATTGTVGVYGGATSGATTFPTISISAPPAGGTQATAHVAQMSLYSAGTSNIDTAGSGYQVNDVVTLAGGTYSLAASLTVTSVDGSGAVTGLSRNYISGPPGGQSGIYTAIPPAPTAVTGGHGTGLTLWKMGWRVLDPLVIDAAGSGYTVLPAVTFSGTTDIYAGGGIQQAATVTLSNSFTAAGASGQVALTNAGTVLGVPGPSGAGVVLAGALMDGTGTRQTLTSSGYVVPANVSLVRLTQTSTLAAATVTLPTALGDGQLLQFVNYGGAVTALTFSPAVNGWTNGSTFAAYTGLRIRWDATAAAWYVENPAASSTTTNGTASPGTGTTVTIPDNQQFTSITPSGALASLTVALPGTFPTAVPCQFIVSQNVAALTVTPPAGTSIVGSGVAATYVAAGTAFTYRLQGTIWFRVQ